MSKNRIFAVLAVLISLVMTQTQQVTAQDMPLRWKVTLGLGMSGSEAMDFGFAKGAQGSVPKSV